VEDPGNPVMFSTDNGVQFQGPAHGTLIQTQPEEWFVTFHAHETAFYSLGRQMLMQPIRWTEDGWWRPLSGKVPSLRAKTPDLPGGHYSLSQSDEFDAPKLGLQWFFGCGPDFSGKQWSLSEEPGCLRIQTQPGDLGHLEALHGVFQQRVTEKSFRFETKVTFDASEGREAAGLHMYHDPLMNLWLASTVRDGEKVIAVGSYNLGRRTDLWSVANPYGDTVYLQVEVDGQEGATFFFSGDGERWQRVGREVYFGASAHHLRNGRRGNPDLGWVGTYKDPSAPSLQPAGPAISSLPGRRGNTWTATTFGVFAVRDGASQSRPADFDFFRVGTPTPKPE
jgi:beta-xylosidase